MKVVVSRCHGGFGLSEDAIYAYAERRGLTLYPEASRFGRTTYWTVPPDKRSAILDAAAFYEATPEERQASNEAYKQSELYDRDIPRDDPDLIAVVETMGAAASGQFAALEVVDIPDDVEWQIEEYDGAEWVAEKHRTW